MNEYSCSSPGESQDDELHLEYSESDGSPGSSTNDSGSGPEDDEEDVDTFDLHYNFTAYESDIAKTPLYEGSAISLTESLAMQFSMFTTHPHMSKHAVSNMLKMQKAVLPQPNNLPETFSGARKIIEPFLIRKKVYHVCPNECVIFRNTSPGQQLRTATKCPQCGADRYYDSTSRRPSAKKRFVYLPVAQRFSRMYGDVNLAKVLANHPGGEEFHEDDVMYDIHDSPTWRNLYAEEGEFGGDKRGLSLALEMDGVNPFHWLDSCYSMTPITLTLLNLPRKIRHAFGNIILAGIIPGTRVVAGDKGKRGGETRNLDIYVEVLVDELLQMTTSTAVKDHQGAPVDVKFKLLLHILDYKGMCKLFNVHGTGAIRGCLWCRIRGIFCKHLDEVVYLDNRRYLPVDSPLRQDDISFPDKMVDARDPPALSTQHDTTLYAQAISQAKNPSQAKQIAKATGVKGNYPLMRLPGHDRPEQTKPDPMHTIKDVIENVVKFVSGKSDSYKVRNHEESIGRFKGCTAPLSSSPEALPAAPFVLTSAEKELANSRATTVKFRLGYGWKSVPFFDNQSALKSHDWFIVGTKDVMKFCLRGCLGETQRETLMMLCDALAKLTAESHSKETVSDAKVVLEMSLARLERDFPVTLMNITTHMLHHMPKSLDDCGPIYSYMMFVYEQLNAWLCQRALNKRYPEATIIETWRIFDWCHYMAMSGRVSTESVTTDLDRMKATAHSQGHGAGHGAGELHDDLQEFAPDANNTFSISKRKLAITVVHYKRIVPAFGCPSNEYERERKLAAARRVLSSFPTFVNWNPRSRYLNNEERLLTYPITKKGFNTRRYQFEDPHTGRMITFSGSRHEKVNASALSSYISFTNADGDMVFGRIKSFCTHKFVDGRTTTWALVQSFPEPQYHHESGLWFCRDMVADSDVIVPVSSLSQPLGIGRDAGDIWFLNVQCAN